MNVTWGDQPWAEAFGRAILGVDGSNRLDDIREAMTAIRARIKELADSPEGRDELNALNDALVLLRVWEKNVA